MATSATGWSTAACPAARSSTTSRGGSPTSAARREPASSSAATAAWRATSTATAPPTSTSPLPGNDALLWNDGKGHFSEGARAAGITAWGWHTGAAVADVNGDGRPDIFVSGYADVNAPAPSDCRVPEQLPGRPRPPLPQHRQRRERPRPVPRGRREGAHRQRHARARSRRRVHGRERRRPSRPLRRERRQPEPAVPERPVARVAPRPTRSGSASGWSRARPSAGLADPNAGMGIAAADYSGDGRPDLVVTNSHKQLHGVFRSDPPSGGSAALPDARADIASAFDTSLAGLGRVMGRSRQRHQPRPGDRERRHPRGRPRAERGAGAGLREPHRRTIIRASSPPRARCVGLDAVPEVNGRGLAAADFDNDGHVDLAVNSIGGKLMLLRNTGAKGNWLEVALPRFAPGAVVTAVLPDGRRLVQEIHAGSSYLSSEDPRAHFGLGKATTVEELTVRYPGGRETRLSDVTGESGAWRIGTLTRPPRRATCPSRDSRSRRTASSRSRSPHRPRAGRRRRRRRRPRRCGDGAARAARTSPPSS